MPSVTFLPVDAPPIIAELLPDMTLMEVALINDVPGIIGMCGGICSCATCHVYVAADWADRLPAMTQEERAMVDALDRAGPTSRLGCQVRLEPGLDGLTVRVALPE
ncbi:2Fe-2S iron-sulfur cluster-binding protein [Sphingomonas jatrophae]|uniref:Ferredoxin, 2Fe-2S n=1 Tax=Sphingomonas jatrophae TaxID=1166337 RepID=A0A1I6KFH6_9SPHN|nr:2Fe-2S iron-sulfur cluster-binding protein [Sphingomonas jatrophae]SFR89946.1 ferredoxin, 2Fe-2S [Sphingomonas jatrophae]